MFGDEYLSNKSKLMHFFGGVGAGVASIGAVLFAVVLSLAVSATIAANLLSDAQWMSLLWIAGLLFIWLALFSFLKSSKNASLTDKAIAILVAILGAFAMTSYVAASGDYLAASFLRLLISDAPIFLNSTFNISLPHLDAAVPMDGPAAERFSERNREITSLALATLVSTTVVISFSGVFVHLRKIINILGLSDQQLAFARKLSAKAKSAIPSGKSLAQLYPKEVQFNSPSDLRRQFPLGSGHGQKARLKLVIRDNAPPDPSVNWGELEGLLRSADLSLPNSFFTICKAGPKGRLPIVAYGTGSELRTILEMTEPSTSGSDISTALTLALHRNQISDIEKVIEDARKLLLQRGSDVLLSTTSAPDSDTLQSVLVTMHGAKLNRILLTAPDAPQERGILGAAEINGFLMAV